jgi:GNAT superfamily N-acetyltransferase
MSSSLLEEFTFLPISFPDDALPILHLHYHIYVSDPLHSQSHNVSEDEFVSAGLSVLKNRFNKPNNLAAKIVLSSDPSKIVSYIVWNPPEVDATSDKQREKDFRADIERGPSGRDTEKIYNMKMEDRVLNERYLGKGYEGRWWTLEVLMTDGRFQRRGLGSGLVRWGLEKVEHDVKNRNEKGEGERIEGAYLIASPAGARTYEKAGFVRVGERTVEVGPEGKKEGYTHAWFVKRFEHEKI